MCLCDMRVVVLILVAFMMKDAHARHTPSKSLPLAPLVAVPEAQRPVPPSDDGLHISAGVSNCPPPSRFRSIGGEADGRGQGQTTRCGRSGPAGWYRQYPQAPAHKLYARAPLSALAAPFRLITCCSSMQPPHAAAIPYECGSPSPLRHQKSSKHCQTTPAAAATPRLAPHMAQAQAPAMAVRPPCCAWRLRMCHLIPPRQRPDDQTPVHPLSG